MNEFSLSELTDLEAEYNSQLVDSALIHRPNRHYDDEGGQVDDTPLEFGPYSCLYGVLPTREVTRAGQEQVTTTAIVAFRKFVDVQERDSLVVTIIASGETVQVDVDSVARSSSESWRTVTGTVHSG